MKFLKKDQSTHFLKGGGEMGDIIRNKDWSETSVGNPSQWPSSLRVLLNTLLNSRFPMFLFWGDEWICFYNDAYRPSLGKEGKHPYILGEPAVVAWPEIWPTIKPLLDKVYNKGESTWSEDQLIPIYRNGKIDDAYWTFSYSPAFGVSGLVEGVFVALAETTSKVQYLKKLEQSEEQLSNALEAAHMGAWDLDPQKGTFTTNKKAQQWFGLPPGPNEDLEDIFEKIIEEDREQVRQAVEDTLANSSDGNYDVVYRIRKAEEGDIRTLRALGRAWFNEDGQPYRFNGIVQDITAQHNIDKERHKLISLIDSSNQFIALADPDQQLQFANAAAVNMLGWENINQRKLIDFVYEKDRTKAEHLLANLPDKGFFSTEIRFFDEASKKPFWLKWNMVVVKDPHNGEILGYGTVSTNIEEQRAREAQLELALDRIVEQERKFRNLVKQAPVGIAIFKGEDFLVELANTTALAIVKKEERQVLGVPFFDILPDTQATLMPMLNEVLLTGKSSRGTNFPIAIEKRGKKETRYFNFIFYPVKDEDDLVTGVMCVATEVTESVLLSNKLKESAKQFRNLVIQSPIPMTILRGPEFVIEMANDIMIDIIWRKDKEEVIGKKLLDIFPGLVDQKYPELLNKIIAKGETLTVKESHARIEGNDGTREFYLDYDYAPLRELDGTVSGIMVTVNDVTDKVHSRKKLEEFSKELEKQVYERTELLNKTNLQLRDSIRELEQTNEELQSFAYISSHDLQEPLRKIQVFTSRIKERSGAKFTDRDEQDFSRIIIAATRMRTLIEDLLAFSKTSTSQGDFRMMPIADVLEEVKEDLSDKLQEANASIVTGELCEIKMIPFQVHQLLINLLENSIKFSKPDVDPEIHISSEKVAGKNITEILLDPKKMYCQITISDNGIGFEGKYGERIFQVFQRLHGRNQFEGTGIGLAIVKKIVQNHNGGITAESEPGKGATFRIYLPVEGV
ncbi:PAS domain-containing protein [Zeaxanthinibacter sp. PT1]|uniref:PAS domain-containing sensor histidine kinase n=1 Tax=Zeaxanthinibacter TaxID=561554 RepID=UPI00234A37E7|nr:PAS domain-containing protein [Zeaxanthinibacter sp. PT1]MDC6350233.1 PAS domain-containing protein [Zeaxanthinibacter sp. PT1]